MSLSYKASPYWYSTIPPPSLRLFHPSLNEASAKPVLHLFFDESCFKSILKLPVLLEGGWACGGGVYYEDIASLGCGASKTCQY